MENVKEESKKSHNKKLRALLNVEDYHKKAKEILQQMTYDFYGSGSDDQITLVDNQNAYRRIKLRPKILVDVSSHSLENSINCQTELLNSRAKISFPCLIAPTSFHRLANNEHGELATVRAAVACSTIMCVSTAASISLERIAHEHQRLIKEKYPQSCSQLWYQLYVVKDRTFSQKLIQRAEKSGYKALVLTVDVPEIGNREADIHNHFQLPNGIQSENLIDEQNNLTTDYRKLSFDPSLSWKDIDWLRSITSLPIILKGVMHPDDARLAVKHGINAIIVSNHGGRQLDTTQSTIDALPDIIAAVGGKNSLIDVYVDGGIRRGTDIFKAIALGAKAVLIGRPVLWGLAVDGEQDVTHVLQILKKEFRLAMILSGCQTIEQIRTNDILLPNHKNISKL